MPLAVVRAKVADLPLQFSFDDSMALSGGQKISDLGTISIEARVAKAGKAQSSSGGLFGIVKGVKPGTRDVKVVIRFSPDGPTAGSFRCCIRGNSASISDRSKSSQPEQTTNLCRARSNTKGGRLCSTKNTTSHVFDNYPTQHHIGRMGQTND